MNVVLDFAVVVGSRLVRSDELDQQDERVQEALQRRPLDGALILKAGSVTVLDEHLWDRLDELVVQLKQVIDRMEDEQAPGSIEFPDTRVALTFHDEQDGKMSVLCEHQEAVCKKIDFVQAGRDLIERFERIVPS